MGGGVCVCLCHDIWHDKMIFQMFRFYGISTFFFLYISKITAMNIGDRSTKWKNERITQPSSVIIGKP